MTSSRCCSGVVHHVHAVGSRCTCTRRWRPRGDPAASNASAAACGQTARVDRGLEAGRARGVRSPMLGSVGRRRQLSVEPVVPPQAATSTTERPATAWSDRR